VIGIGIGIVIIWREKNEMEGKGVGCEFWESRRTGRGRVKGEGKEK